MKTMKTKSFSNSSSSLHSCKSIIPKGFSIVEVAIAMAVVTLLLTTFLGIFGPAQANIQRSLNTKDANRMKDALTNELSILRSTDSPLTNSFAKAFKYIGESHAKSTALIIFEYRAEAGADTTTGILPPYSGTSGIQGKDYVVQTAVRSLATPDRDTLKSELAVVQGPVFVIRMTQLVDNDITDTNITLTPWVDGSGDPIVGVTDPDAPGTALAHDTYPKAVVALRAEFFKLNANKYTFIDAGNWDFTNTGNALVEANIAIRR